MRSYGELGFAEIGERLDRSGDACRKLHARVMAALAVAMHRQLEHSEESASGRPSRPA